MELTLETSLQRLPGVGQSRAKGLERLGLRTVGDLLHYFPRDYEDRTILRGIQQAEEGEAVCVSAMVAEAPRLSRIRAGLELTKARAVDGAYSMTVVFFNQSYVKDALRPGETYIFYGKMEVHGRHRQMTNPIFEREDRARFTGRIMPVYPLTAGLSNHLLAGLAQRCVEACAEAPPELLPQEVLQRYTLAQSAFSYRNIHFPEHEQALALARRRLIFEELFFLSCGLALLRTRRELGQGLALLPQDLGLFYSLLPFPLTGAQKRVIEEAAADLYSGRPMNRLVQGDVGSGKTMVAAACAWIAFQSGFQSALMVPTEILAGQHARSLSALLAPAGIQVGLLTGSLRAAEKRQVRAALEAGEIHLLVGTHAILSEGVGFQRLGLVVTDEQHRFGVAQRAALSSKAAQPPHVLVMSATPIPRTLALIIYGDLEVSVIDELPPGRTAVETYVIGEDKRARMYAFVRRLVQEGRQVYMVCPAVEENPDAAGPARKAAAAYAGALEQEVFPELRVALVHGKLKPKEKNAVMEAFTSGQVDILVSTTVIEVGVDVPNAALIVVENAECFGLSQLHQLRGRVGRGEHQSYCVLMTDSHSAESRARLKVLSETNDGFRISEEDLKLRGPGDFFGSRQHGLPQLRIADLAGDMRILKDAQSAARETLLADTTLSGHQALLDRVKQLFAEHADIFN